MISQTTFKVISFIAYCTQFFVNNDDTSIPRFEDMAVLVLLTYPASDNGSFVMGLHMFLDL